MFDNVPYPFRENLWITGFIAKILRSDIKLIFCSVINMCKVIAFGIGSATNEEWVQRSHVPCSLVFFWRGSRYSLKILLLLNALS